METLIAEGIGKTYKGRQVVRGVNLKISRGEVVGLLGPNGAGKTTSFYMIVGWWRRRPGASWWTTTILRGCRCTCGRAISASAICRRSHRSFASSRWRRTSWRCLRRSRWILANGRSRAERLIAQLNLGHIRGTRGYALSGGERRRVEIARSLCIQPNFILLDEPFSGIDPIAVLELQKIIFDLKASGIGILITDHNVRETLSVTDRAYIIAEGRIFRAGTPHELGNDVEVRRIYLGEGFSLN